jgi:SUKH superfamily protein
MTAIDELIRLVPPPTNPVSAQGDWQQIETELGLHLPTDFKQLVERYGLGQFVDFITPLTPFGPHALLIRHAHRLLESEQAFRARNPDKSPYALYPEPGGLLEWAGTDNGDRLCWLTTGDPDQWTTVAWNPRSWRFDPHPVGAVDFLHGWLTGDITTTVFGDANTTNPWFA